MGRHGTIAGRKAAQDSKRAAMFTKYARAITVAANPVEKIEIKKEPRTMRKSLVLLLFDYFSNI